MAHTNTPPLCPNPECRASLAEYKDVAEYTRVAGLKIAACAYCGVALSVWPSEIEKIDEVARKVSRLR